jgi:hypothetical protein
MRVEPQVSSVSPTPINLGNGIQAPAFNVNTVQTTVLAADGETIVLGGLITKQDQRIENGLPYLKDIPYVGALFRYRTHSIQRREVLIIMTPHIVRTEMERARILAEESQRLNWCLPDIGRLHGHGMDVIGPASQGARPVPLGPGMNGAQPAPGPAFFGTVGPDAKGAAQPGSTLGQPQPFNTTAQPTATVPAMPTIPGLTAPTMPMIPGAAGAEPPAAAPVPGHMGVAPVAPGMPLPPASPPGVVHAGSAVAPVAPVAPNRDFTMSQPNQQPAARGTKPRIGSRVADFFHPQAKEGQLWDNIYR